MAYINKSFAVQLVKVFQKGRGDAFANIHGLAYESGIWVCAYSDGMVSAHVVLDHSYQKPSEYLGFLIRNLTDVSIEGEHLCIRGDIEFKIPVRCDYAYLREV